MQVYQTGLLSDYVKVPCGGTKLPLTGNRPRREDCYLRVNDPAALDAIFSRTYLKNYLMVIHEALENSGYTVEDIDHIFTNQVKMLRRSWRNIKNRRQVGAIVG